MREADAIVRTEVTKKALLTSSIQRDAGIAVICSSQDTQQASNQIQ